MIVIFLIFLMFFNFFQFLFLFHFFGKKKLRTSVEKNKVEVMKPFYIYFYVSLLTSKNY